LKVPYAQALESIKVAECTPEEVESGAYHLENVELDVQAYQLRVPTEPQNQNVVEQEKNDFDGPQARIIPLPSKEFDGIWESYG
jgi:hypothetical protein